MTNLTPVPAAITLVPGDPIKVLQHTLSNGLKLFMSVNKNEPRVYTEIAVRAGSKHDPADTTGLAHYFEHMMFKGTDRLGTLDWEKEKVLLDRIEELFEMHRNEADTAKKKALYAEIDRLSSEAAKYAATNEYDKLVSSIGAKGTNAYTWVEQTVYVNDIPNNELERWFELESERFRRPILRLFHTELETVFEEYNISQDRDLRKVYKEIQARLTPTHPYGTQTTLGRGEDLKNPSQTNIYRFFDQYYVPNNMAIVMCGDFEPERAIRLAETHFGKFESRPIPEFKFEAQPPVGAREQVEVFGNEAPWVEIAWRFEDAHSKGALILPLLAGILHNYQAGLFDLNLIQKQQLLEAYAYPRIHADFGALFLHGKPREGQSLEEVEALLLAQVQKLANGEFEDWLPEAVLKDMKLSEIKEFEKNQGRASAITNAFVLGLDWSEMVHRWKKLAAISKADLVEFVQKHVRPDNYVVVYKHTGADPSVLKVEKPSITPIEVNRNVQSAFADAFLAKKAPEIAPEFLDFKKTIKNTGLSSKLKLKSIQDRNSQLFRLDYIFNMGRTSDRRLSILANYLPFLGTGTHSPSEIQQAFYRLGLHFSATCQDEHFYLSLTGLEESLEAGVTLMESLLDDAQPNAAALENLVADIFKRRENDKMDKRVVLSKAMRSYAKFGPESPFSDKLSQAELQALTPQELTGLLRTLKGFEHEVFYFGPRNGRFVADLLKKQHLVPDHLQQVLIAKKYKERSTSKNKVFFVHFPMVQVELMLISRGTPHFNMDEHVYSEWYNQYFGYGLSSIVFQEIRESKALAYSAYAFAADPEKRKKSHYLQAYVGTQPDKLQEAVKAFETILEDMPIAPSSMEQARTSVLKQIAADRILKANIYWTWRSNRDKGFLNQDLRKLVYENLENATAEDLVQYHAKYIKGRQYTWLVLGDRARIDFKYLKSIGKVSELSLEEIFGY